MNALIGTVYGPGGDVVEERFEVTRDQVLEGIAWMRCPECFGDPRGYRMPDGSFSSFPCVKCRGRHVVPVMV